MSDEIPASQLSIIVDLTSSIFDIKKLYNYLNSNLKLNLEHHYWHFGGLRSYTTQFNTDDDEILIENLIQQLKHLQTQTSLFPPFWLTHKTCSPDQPISPCEIIKRYQKKFYTDKKFQIEFTSGSLIQLNQYIYDPNTCIADVYCLTFYYDRIEFDYGEKEKPLRKTIKTTMMDRCSVIMTDQNQFTIFFNMNGNAIDYEGVITTDEINPGESKIVYKRTAPLESQSFYSTIRIVIKIIDDNQDNLTDNYQRLNKCHNYFLEYFQRNYIHDCFGLIESCSTKKDIEQLKLKFMINDKLSFIKQYCWHMLLSLGYRFQQRLTNDFIRHLNHIEDDDEFYQTSLHLWRRSNEYYFLDLLAELRRYQEKIANLASLTPNHNDKEETKPERWSLHNPPKHYAYVPSVTLTPTTICVKPFKLVKTNRVLREKRFGDKLMFSLVDIKDENGTIDLFPHDYRALRTKISTLLEYGFDLGCQGRTYRYLHHSQSQLKDKQFWFYHHDGKTNFSFEEAFAWMGDFQEERIVAKHAARIAQCFTSAEETIPIPSNEVEYIKDIHTDDKKYNFTDGVGTMSTLIRNKINPHRQFSAIQIRYGGCKGVISVNPDLDDSPHQLRIRNSMKKFECSHVMLELCRISKPRPLYLNRQIIVLLSHRKIDDRIFLTLQNKHQKFLSESLVYPDRAYELLSEKLNRNLFPLPALIHHARLNLIQEPFFRQLLITTGKFELAQMKERTRLKLPKNKARNMIGIVDEYGILEYGQVFIQYTELTGEYINNTESEKTIILEQKVVVTKNPCHHPGDIRVFDAIDVPRLRHLKDVIVFPQRGKRPHPNEISGSDLDGDEYAVIWHPAFIPQTPNDTPYDYDSQVPMLRVDRPVNRTDIRNTVLDISEQSCAGKLCSIHLAFVDRYGVADEQTLKIAGYISEELDAPKTGQHPLTPRQIVQLQEELKNERPDYFDKPYYRLYPSEHVLGQLFRSCLRFEPNWINVQTPPTTSYPAPIDPLLVHDKQSEYRTSVEELARIYRECIMDIMYVYRFSSDVDLLCRFDSTIPQHRATLTKQQTESACLVADSAQVELRQLIRRTERLFYDDLPSCEQHDPKHSDATCTRCLQRKKAAMAKASALYIFCYTDTRHARRMLSLPWLFATLLIKVRKLNIEKQSKLLSPTHVSQMLEIQPYRLIGQSLLQAVQYFLQTKTSFYFHHIYTNQKVNQITVSLRRTSETKRLLLKRELSLLDYLLIEIFQHYVFSSLSQIRSPLTDSKPNLLDSVWQHILTRFILQKPSKLVLLTSTTNENKNLLNIQDYQFWSDEQAWTTLQRLIQISAECANEYSNDSIDDEYSEESKEKAIDYVHANEYLISILQKMATTGCLFS